MSDPAPTGPEARVTLDAALRAIMFTDIVDSTGMTARLGDARAVEMVRAHDAMVRRGLKDTRGREVKHTGDGIMASFEIPRLRCNALGRSSKPSMPSTSRAKRSCACASAWMSESLLPTATTYSERPCKRLLAYVRRLSRMLILVSGAVRDALRDTFELRELGARPLKGFARPVAVYEVQCR